jgi:predicted Zn finger-like uncharacterized protein
MAIVTLCPQCQTAFAVQAEHYSAADAWVRCGRCAHVFEVDQHLYELDDNKPQPAPLEVPLALRVVPGLPPPQALVPPWAWSVLSVLLALLFCFQALFFQRHQWRAQNPELTPVFLSLCRHLGCELDWPMDPSKVSIETGGFKSLGGDAFMFSGSIKNQSDWPMATPMLELNLTDEVEASLVRKAFSPEELGLTSVLRGRRAQSFELRFTLNPALSPSVQGYRAFLFYP